MKSLLNKEFRLAASPLSYWFLAGSLMTLLPGYPILMSAFFVCMGIFQSFQNARESNDVLYTLLLPVPKRDLVRGKFAFSCLVQLAGFVLCAALTALRMNALMNATPVFLAFYLQICTAFNVLFVGGFFRTAQKLGGPFLHFSIAAFVLVGIAETLPHLPGLGFLHTPSGERLGLQLAALAAAAIAYAAVTWAACRASEKRMERIDL